MGQYIFGYGSLISHEAREHTAISGRVYPARVRGYRRIWSGFPLCSWAPLGVRRDDNATCNGVVFEVDDAQFALFDEREDSYSRNPVDHADIELLQPAELGSGFVWIYVPLDPRAPSKDMPILQSYVDVAVTGCLEYSDEFAREFVETTSQWSTEWRDDRDSPHYVRALRELKRKDAIDAMLHELLPDIYSERYKIDN